MRERYDGHTHHESECCYVMITCRLLTIQVPNTDVEITMELISAMLSILSNVTCPKHGFDKLGEYCQRAFLESAPREDS